MESDSKAVKCNLRRGAKVGSGSSKSVRIRLNPRRLKSQDESLTVRLNFVTNDPMTPLQVVKVAATIHKQEANDLDK